MSRSSFTASAVNSGKIKLQSQEIPFAHLPHFCDVEHVLKIMLKEWHLEFPKIMLLIVSDNLPLKRWDRYRELENFMNGLVKGSNATSMWILTTGLDNGIAKKIGNALQNDYDTRYSQICHRHAKQKIEVSKTPLIGLCRESLLTYCDQFENPENIINLENKGNILEEQKFNLNPYHTHFLIIQKTSYFKDVSNRFLLRLIDALRLIENPASDTVKELLPESPVEIIAILVQGNTSTIHYILAHLKRKLPVLIIQGSGGLADIFSYVYYEVRRSFQKVKDQEYVETVLTRGIRDKISSTFPALKDNKVARRLLCTRILECIECCEPPELKQITILNLLDLTCNMEDLPSYTLQALFKAQHTESLAFYAQLIKDLQLTIDWNCPELALSKVFYRDPTFQVKNDVFEQVLLERGREPFVSLFLDNGFPIHKYLSATRLIGIFEKVLKEEFFYQVIWEGVLGYGQVMKLDESFINNDLNWIIEVLVGIPVFVSANTLTRDSAEIFDVSYSEAIAIDVAKRKSLITLLIWALISNRPQLALVFWRHAAQPIMTALAASLTLDKMMIYINDKNVKEETAELSRKFASIATGVFDLCYNDMPSKAYDALNVRTVEWNNRALIDIASLTENKTFVSHPCCQKWLTNKFMGNIKIRELTWGFMTFPIYIKVILCAFFIFPMYLWVRFKGSNVDEFLGENDYEGNDPYFLSEKKYSRLRAPRDDVGRSHLLKYHYPPLWQMISWMWSAPITKFWVSNIFYIIYLAIFSLAVLWPSCGSIYLDSIICVWTCLIAVDSTYKLFSVRKAFPNIPAFASCLEIIYIITFVIFFSLIRISDYESLQDPYAGKVLICGALLCFYYRMIFIYLPISSTLGPLLYWVKRMITVDFLNFMKLVVFILIGNGIAMQAILYPDYPLIPEMVRKSFHKAFIAFFMTPVGELTATESNCIKWEQKPSSDTMCRVSNYVDGKCSDGIAFWPYVLVLQYMLLLKLILMTVLFALFSTTGAKIGPEMASIWKLQRYHLILNFSNSLRLPPPLNIFSVIIILYKFFVRCCKEGLSFLNNDVKDEKEDYLNKQEPEHLSTAEYTYWQQLASDYYAIQEEEIKEESYIKKELDAITHLSEDLSMKETLIYKAKAQITQLESDMYFTHTHLETLKYHAKEEVTKRVSHHCLSRESPYPRTKIKRFPVPDKYVPWEVLWLHYEPSAYTTPKEDFSQFLQPYVDDDILSMKKEQVDLPVYSWNIESVDKSGVYMNRKSWIKDRKDAIITYPLDKFNLPRNPMGRTGLRGKGALPRWGPNHNAFVIITRWKAKTSEKEESLTEASDQLEYVETWFMKKKDLSLPGGFAWSENRYQVIQNCFVMEEDSKPWETSDDMIQFFKDQAVGLTEDESTEEFKCKLMFCGYMDDQMNTDQAWKEVELWHVHYNILTNLYRKFKANIRWKVLTEDVFIQLPYGQTNLLQDTIRPLNAKMELL